MWNLDSTDVFKLEIDSLQELTWDGLAAVVFSWLETPLADGADGGIVEQGEGIGLLDGWFGDATSCVNREMQDDVAFDVEPSGAFGVSWLNASQRPWRMLHCLCIWEA